MVSCDKSTTVEADIHIFIAAWKAEQLPNPVRKDKKQSMVTLKEPAPASKATILLAWSTAADSERGYLV